ncbi:MAG: CvpA family protein [Novosphingobium sp.]|uniref:CvpA family protein n=1 Tax=Tsuneonella sp. CC-YZS046 TaxID=3042152 RepID=UPI002D779B93|nr:CvpA family protein [Tsuneonella sp. CC-YZS046]WRO67720.1 CvpA family protein [Tsuneonella sp. CC-YZS046]
MSGFDIIVLILVAVAAIGGFMRGFVQEVLSLAAWILALFAIRSLHTPLTNWFIPKLDTATGAAILSFSLLLLIPYAGMKLIASHAGRTTRASILGPLDRILGLGFGALKGLIIAVLAFSVLALGYDTVWGVAGRPAWITTSRSYPFVNAAADELVEMIAEHRRSVEAQARSDPKAAR